MRDRMPDDRAAAVSPRPASAAATSSRVNPWRVMRSTTSINASCRRLTSAPRRDPADELERAIGEGWLAAGGVERDAGGAFAQPRFAVGAGAEDVAEQSATAAV